MLLTVDYTALDSPSYRQTVIRSLDRSFSADRTFSLRNDVPDAWFQLSNPDGADPAGPLRGPGAEPVRDLARMGATGGAAGLWTPTHGPATITAVDPVAVDRPVVSLTTAPSGTASRSIVSAYAAAGPRFHPTNVEQITLRPTVDHDQRKRWPTQRWAQASW